MSDLDGPMNDADWEAFRAARERFFAAVRPEAMEEPPHGECPDAPPEDWPAGRPGGPRGEQPPGPPWGRPL